MIKLLAAGIWGSVVCAGAAYYTVTARPFDRLQQKAEIEKPVLETVTTPKFSIPVFSQGELHGYLFVKLAATASSPELKKLTVKLEDFVVDEAFRVLYGRTPGELPSTDAGTIEATAAAIASGVNVRLKVDVVKAVLVKELSLVKAAGVRH